MRKRGIIGTLLLLMYLAGVGLFTGPSLAQAARWPSAAAKAGADSVRGYDFRADGQKRGRTGRVREHCRKYRAAVSARTVPAAVLAVVRAGGPHHRLVLRHLAQH